MRMVNVASRQVLTIAASLTLCTAMLAGCSPQTQETTTSGTPMESSSQATEEFSYSIATTPSSSTGTVPSTPEELQLASKAAEELNVPYNGKIVCTIGEPFYSEEFGMEVRSISFYEDDKLAAGADCTEDGTLVGNFVYY